MSAYNPKLDLTFERVVDIPPALVWEAWTKPEHYPHWFCPRPWQTVEAKIDLRPGGRFFTVMESPEGDQHENEGVFLEIVENKRLIWTNALEMGFRPATIEDADDCSGFAMTAQILLEPHGKTGTKYRAVAMHKTPEARKKHEEMGFEQGWGLCLDQLVEHMKGQSQ